MSRSNTLQVLLVPVAGAVEARTIPHTLEAMQGLVGGLLERVTLSSRKGRTTLLYVNEEGIGLGLPVNSRLTQAFGVPLLEQPLHGPGFICAVTGPEWETVSLSDEEIAAWSRMLFLLGDDRLREVPS